MKIKKIIAGLSSFLIALTAAATPLQEVIKAPQILPQTGVTASAYTYGDFVYLYCGGYGSGKVAITDYTGSAQILEIPSEINGNAVVEVSYNAFEECDTLTSVTIPSGVEIIDEQAFLGCDSLTYVSIPDTVTTYEDFVFLNCPKLTTIDVSVDNPNYSSQDGVLFNKDKTTLIRCPEGKSGTYTIPDSVQIVDAFSFRKCKKLTSIVISEGVKRLKKGCFADCMGITDFNLPSTVSSIEETVYNGCTSLNNINVAYGNSWFKSEDGILFNGMKTSIRRYPLARTGAYTIPDGVTTIYHYAFYSCSNLTSITLNDDTKEMGDSAFCNCSSLTSFEFTDSFEVVSFAAFKDCKALKTVKLPASLKTILASAFNGCTSLASIDISDSVIEMHEDAFTDTALLNNQTTAVKYAGKWAVECDEEATGAVTVKSGTIGIAHETFEDCNNITSATIPDSVIYMGGTTFYSCDSLTSVKLSNGITVLPELCFMYCDNLTEIQIPYGVTVIGPTTFFYCTALAKITIPDTVTEIGSNAFCDCTALNAVYYTGTADS